MKELIKYTKGYRRNMVLSPILVILEVFMEVVIPYLMGNIVNNGITGGDMEYIRQQSMLLVICAIVSLASGVGAGWVASNASTGFAKNLRVAVYEKLQLFSFKNIDRFSQGGIVTRLTSDIFYVQVACQMIIRIAVRLPIMLVFALVMAIRISGDLARIYAIALPFLALCFFLISRIVMPIYTRAFNQIDELNNSTQESLHAVRVVKSFVRQDYEKEKFDNVINKLYRMLLKAETTVVTNNPIMRLVVYSCITAIAFFGSKYIIVDKTMLPGNLMALFIYNFQMFFSMMMFAMILAMIVMSRSCYRRIMDVLDEKLDLANCENPVMDVKNGDIEFSNVSFSYYGDMNKTVLDNINLNIKSGEQIGIVGATGSGKTSLVNLIARLYDVTDGELRVGGVDVRKYDMKTLRDNVSTVLQKNILFSGTIRSSLQWGKHDASDEEIWNALKIAQISDFVSALPEGLDYEVEQQGSNFSGGQRQRLCIARALLKNPKIIILDDSSSALDTATDRQLRASLRNDRPDLTKIIIAHKVLSVMNCDRIVVMKSGTIEDVGTHSELVERNRFYRDLYISQMQKEGENE